MEQCFALAEKHVGREIEWDRGDGLILKLGALKEIRQIGNNRVLVFPDGQAFMDDKRMREAQGQKKKWPFGG